MANPMIARIAAVYLAIGDRLEEWARPLLLLAIRICWGYQLTQTGLGKIRNHDAVAAWFRDDLHIPMPELNAWMAAGTELVCGALLLVGLGSRAAAAPVIFTMCVAYATSDIEAVRGVTLDNWDSFLEAAPFLFLFAAVLVLVLGPGPLSVDGVIYRWWRGRSGAAS